MRIFPAYTRNLNIQKTTNNHNGYSQYITDVLGAPKCDTVSFGRSAKNAEPLRKLMQYGIPDLYSGKNIIPPEILENLFSRQVFSKGIKQIVKTLKPYQESLYDVEAEVFKKLSAFAYLNPNKTLSQAMQIMALEENKKLLETQLPIFNEINAISRKLPEKDKIKYKELMHTTLKKLNAEPIVQKFSTKEFVYKLQRIADEHKAKNNQNESLILKLMLKLAQKMPEKTEEELVLTSEMKSKAKRNKAIQKNRSLVRRRAQNLKEIEKLFLESSLKKNKDLEELIAVTRAKIYNIPTIIPFNRKSFIHDLQKITDTFDDQKLAHQMIVRARKLPTSHEDVSAFIVKFSHSSSEKIGYNLLCTSVGNIEHLEAYKHRKGDNDFLGNYAITSAYMNTQKGDSSLASFMRKHPKIYEFAQKHINRLIELYNNKTFQKVGLNKWYILNLVQKLEKLSPEEKPLIIDISRLKI